MIYFKAFDKNLVVEKGSVIGNVELNNKGIKIYKNPIFVINPTNNTDIYVVIPKMRTTNSNGDSVFCKLIELGDKINVEDMLTMDIDIDYKITLVKRIFDRDIQKKYDLFNHIYDIDKTGEMLFKFAKSFPNAINKTLMYELIAKRDLEGTYLAKFTVMNNGYNYDKSCIVASESGNYQALVHMAVNGFHRGLVSLQSDLIKNCNDIVALKTFLDYLKTIKGSETYLLENKIYYLGNLYEESMA